MHSYENIQIILILFLSRTKTNLFNGLKNGWTKSYLSRLNIWNLSLIIQYSNCFYSINESRPVPIPPVLISAKCKQQELMTPQLYHVGKRENKS